MPEGEMRTEKVAFSKNLGTFCVDQPDLLDLEVQKKWSYRKPLQQGLDF